VAVDGRRHVVAFGGLPWRNSLPVGRRPFRDFLCGLTGRAGPRIAVLTTASGDEPAGAAQDCGWFEGGGAEVGHLALFPMPSVADSEDFLLSRDLIFVGGGSVANMVAVWRVHQLDRILRAAWQAGVVLAGVSAGAICWFEGGTTDSFGPDLRPFIDGLGFLAGSYCPHYDSEPGRRPLFTSLVAACPAHPATWWDRTAAAGSPRPAWPPPRCRERAEGGPASRSAPGRRPASVRKMTPGRPPG